MKLISIETSLLTLCLLNFGQAYDLKALAEYYRPGSGNDTITATATTVAAVETTTQAPTASATTIVSTIPTTTAPISTDAQPTTTTIKSPIYATPAPNPTTTEPIKPATTSANDYYKVPDVSTSIPSIPAPSKPDQSDHSSNLEEMPIGVPSNDSSKTNGNQESSGNHKPSKRPTNSYRPPTQAYPQHPPKYQHTQPNYNAHNNQGQQGNYYPTNAQVNPKLNWNQFKQGFENFVSGFKQEYNDYQSNLNKQQQYSAPVYSNNNNGYTASNGYSYNGNTNANIYGNSNNHYQQSNNWSYF
jgi:hypothetical protein